MHSIKITQKTLKPNNIRVNQKKFYMSKKAIDLMSVNVNKIVVSNKCNHNEDCYKFLLVIKKVKLLNHMYYFTSKE